MAVLLFLLGFAMKIVYSSYFEWMMHRHGMHERKIARWAFDNHNRHHRQFLTGRSFYDLTVRYRLIEASKIPMAWVVHWPIYGLVWWLAGPWVAAGMITAGLLYIIGYEVLHYYIHSPKDRWFLRNKLFYLACERHRTHHHKPFRHMNVLFPLWDLLCGTYVHVDLPPEPNAPERLRQFTGVGSV